MTLFMEGRATSGAGNADLFATVFRANRVSSVGSIQIFDVPQDGSRLDSFVLNCRAPGDTIFIRLSQSVGSFDYRLRYEETPPVFADDGPGNETAATATPITFPRTLEGQIGFALDATTDLADYYSFTNPGSVSLRLQLELENENRNEFPDFFVAVLDSTGAAVRGTANVFDLRRGISNHIVDLRCLPKGKLILRITQSAGCIAYRAQASLRDEQPVAAISISRFGNQFAFAANELKADKISWNLGDGTTSTLRFPTRSFPIGVFDIALKAENTTCRLVAERTERVVVEGIESFQPRVAEMALPYGSFNLRIFGGGFSDATEVTLRRGGLTLRPTQQYVPEPGELTVFFAFDEAVEGIYDLTVKLASGLAFDFPGGFEIVTGAPGFDIKVEAVGPSRIRTNRWTDFTLNITNDRARVANGVMVGVVLPKGVETNLGDYMARRKGVFTIKGAEWDRLEINRDDFNEEYFGGSFDPDIDTVWVDLDALDEAYGEQKWIEIDTLYERPLVGELYMLYVPLVLGQNTTKLPFQIRSPVNQQLDVVTYAWPETFRDNPMTGKQLDGIKQGALDLSAVLAVTPVPAFKTLGKVVGYWDIATQIIGTEIADAVYGNNDADSEAYKNWFFDAGFEFAGSKIPAGKNLKNNQDAVKRGRKQLAKTARKIGQTESALITNSKGRLKKSYAKDLRKLEYLKRELDGLGEFADEARREAYLDAIKVLSTNRGLNLVKDPIKDGIGLDPADACSTEPKEINSKSISSVVSLDPNAIYGEGGTGAQQYIRRDEPLGYNITFENVDTAEATAQIVRVTAMLDPKKFDLSRTTLGDVIFGGKTYIMEGDRTEFFQDIDLRPGQDLIVRASAKLDTISGAFEWQFTSLNPVTMDLPQGVDDGFLPPNLLAPEGEGGVFFTTRLLPSVTSGDSISAQALIYFDDNDPIATNVWSNVIDETAPVSRLSPNVTSVNDSTVLISYTASDGGSGVETVYLHSRRVGEEWSMAVYPLLSGGTSELILNRDVSYEFYITARDSAGNDETKAARAELAVRNGTVGTHDNISTAPRFTLFPNPVGLSQECLLRSDAASGPAQVEVFDPLGRRVRSSAIELFAGTAVPVPTAGLPSGTYLVRLTEADGTEGTQRMVVQ